MTSFREELETRLQDYKRQRDKALDIAAEMNTLIEYADGLLQVERDTTPPRKEQAGFEAIAPRVAPSRPKSVAQAVEIIIQRGPVRSDRLLRQIGEEFPELDSVTRGAVTATLSYRTQQGKYQRLGRGEYALARSNSTRPIDQGGST